MEEIKNFLPKAVIYRLLKQRLTDLAVEYNTPGIGLKETVLGSYFEGFGNIPDTAMTYENQAENIFTTAPQDAKALVLRMGFDASRMNTQSPTIHIVRNSERMSNAPIGFDSGQYLSLGDGTSSDVKSNFYDCSYNLIVTSQNATVCELVAMLVRDILVSSIDELGKQGFIDPITVSLQDIDLNQSLGTTPVYTIDVGLTFGYQMNIRSFSSAANPKEFFLDLVKRISDTESILYKKYKA